MTRLLNTPIIGPSVAIVDSSWIDMLAGLVPSGIRRMPPDFCATAGAAPRVATKSAVATNPMLRDISLLPRSVNHCGSEHVAAARLENYCPAAVFPQLPVDATSAGML